MSNPTTPTEYVELLTREERQAARAAFDTLCMECESYAYEWVPGVSERDCAYPALEDALSSDTIRTLWDLGAVDSLCEWLVAR